MNNTSINKRHTLGIIGGRGYVGKELLTLIAHHPYIEIRFISSRQLAGQSAACLVKELNQLSIENLTPAQAAAKNCDIIVLALPNGLAAPYVAAIERQDNCQLLIDLSADYRFDPQWTYSLPELDQPSPSVELTKISNPGCYATAMQLAIAPILTKISDSPHCFGVSGFSGAGTTPSTKNDPRCLKDNLIGYQPLEHLHEKEVSHRLHHPIFFSPHVAAFFRGIHMTIQVKLNQPTTLTQLQQVFEEFYMMHPLIKIQTAMPSIKEVINTPTAILGGFSVSQDGERACLTACIDNLGKGAASQALQNINLVLGYDTSLALLPKMAITHHQIPGEQS